MEIGSVDRQLKCLYIISQSGKWGIKEHIRKLHGVWDGVLGWHIEAKYKSEVEKLCSEAGLLYMETTLEFESFDSLKRYYKYNFFRDELEELEEKIYPLKARLGLAGITISELSSADNLLELETTVEGKQLIELLKEHNSWYEKTERIKNEIKIASISLPENSNNSYESIDFINNNSVNYLTNIPPEMPTLVNIVDDGISKAFIRKGIVGQLVGAGGIGKTHWLTQLALAIATGKNFLGKCPIIKPGYVLLVLGENSNEDIHRLIYKTAKSFFNYPDTEILKRINFEAGKRLATLSVTGKDASFIKDGQPSHFYNDLVKKLQEKEPEEGWSCIIFDPISRFLGADAESDNASATRFISLLEKMTQDLKGHPTVLFGHHMTKSGYSSTTTDQTAARGSSALTDGARLQINLERVAKEGISPLEYDPKKVTMRVVKSNHTGIPKAITLLKDDYGCLSIDDSEPAFMPSTVDHSKKDKSATSRMSNLKLYEELAEK